METKYVDNNFGNYHEGKHQDCTNWCQRKCGPQSLPEPVMVGKNSLDHGEEGDAHRGDDEDLEGDSKAVEVVLPDQPLKAQE